MDANEIVDLAIESFDNAEQAIEEKGVDVPTGTDTVEYGNYIRSISGGENSPIKYVESTDTSNPLYLRDLESGTYVLYGKFRPFNGSTSTCTFSTGMLVSVIRNTSISYMQIFYSKNNTIQYCEIGDDTWERTDAKLINMESQAYKTSTIADDLDDKYYPTVPAVKDYVDGKDSHIKYIESLDAENIVNLRDLETGNYVLYGYFSPYANSHTTMTADNSFVNVYRIDEGSHIFCFEPLNAKVVFIEILADETASGGHTYSRTILDMLELNGLLARVDTLETQTGDIETALDNIITIQNELIGG